MVDFDTLFANKMVLTIAPDNIDEDLENFPVLIKLSRESGI